MPASNPGKNRDCENEKSVDTQLLFLFFHPPDSFACKRSKIGYGFYAVLPLFQPSTEADPVQHKDTGTVRIPNLCGVVSIHKKTGIVLHDEGSQHIQKLLHFQIVIVPDPVAGKVRTVDMGEADHSVPVHGEHVAVSILTQGEVQWINENLCALPLLSFWEQAGQRDLQDTVFVLDFDSLHCAGTGKICGFFDGG